MPFFCSELRAISMTSRLARWNAVARRRAAHDRPIASYAGASFACSSVDSK